ncbi:MAG: hypothetical protein HEP71_08895 [Roseivirga sp.]|nr:hypothetical protein [Roseivirga sp.]
MAQENNKSDFVKKFEKGLELSHERLVQSKTAKGGYLVYQKDGKVVKVKASEL